MKHSASASAAFPVPAARARRRARARVDWGIVASGAIWLLCVVNFSSLRIVTSDERVQFDFVERMFGDVPNALGYYFGLALVEAPFYALGKLLGSLGLHTVSGHPVEQTAVALGLGLLTLASWPLLRATFGALSLPRPGFSILAAGLGTPFFYYAAFVPGKNHALSGVLFTAVVFLVVRSFRAAESERWVPPAIGAVFGLAYTVQYFNGAEAVVLIALLLWWRRIRDAVEIAVVSAAVCLLLFVIPTAFGVHVFAGPYKADDVITFAPLNPLRMLFTDHRGYFVWAPVAALAVIGIVLLFRQRPHHRRVLVAVAGMALGLIVSYSLIPFWDGTWAFGQRFYTPLFPVVAIGLGGLLEVRPRLGTAAAVVATAWTLFLCFNLVTIGGPQYRSDTPGGASDLALLVHRTHTGLGAYGFGIWHRSNLLEPFVAWPFGTHTSARSR